MPPLAGGSSSSGIIDGTGEATAALASPSLPSPRGGEGGGSRSSGLEAPWSAWLDGGMDSGACSVERARARASERSFACFRIFRKSIVFPPFYPLAGLPPM